MRYFRIATIAACALALSGCLRSQQPLNPPQLVTARDTDMAIQLFMQASILFGRFYGFETLAYADLQDRSARHGYNVLPFMPPISTRATPGFKQDTLKFTFGANIDKLKGDEFRTWFKGVAIGQGFDSSTQLLAIYYVETGWRAAQIVCRNYLVGLEEQNAYLEFLQKEFNIGATLANASFIAAGANVTLRAIGVGIQWLGNQAIDTYQDYRFLPLVDREVARGLVEAAQNEIAITYLTSVKSKTPPGPPFLTGPTAFTEAIHIVNLIEHQCTRSGIRGLVNKAGVAAAKNTKSGTNGNNGPASLTFDPKSGQIDIK